jgi:glucosamine--fructose-6-phosphate aminotransferase (isomerizing)
MTAVRTPESTRMFEEAASAPAAVAAQLRANRDRVARLGERLRWLHPRAVVTCARGSSDHAATFAKYLIETRIGVLTSSTAPSVVSVYGATQQLERVLCLAISQSGRSPDLLATVAAAKSSGAFVLALVNDATSPLAEAADEVLPLSAGPEISVAATKSYIAALAAITHLVAEWAQDGGLSVALDAAPDQLAQAWDLDWSPLADALVPARGLYAIARGVGLGIAQEAALKLKETCRLHAEAFSAAEVRHGPMALAGADLPVLVFRQYDQAAIGIDELIADFAARGSPVFAAGATQGRATALPVLEAHPAIEPMLQIQSFYRVANRLSLARGLDPDSPPYLSKVTETL